MKIIIHFSLICLLFASCSKKESTPAPAPHIPVPDTLTAGWTKVGTGIPEIATISDVFFTNTSLGYLTTNKGIYKSLDGGYTWNLFDTTSTPYNIGGLGNRFCFIGGDNKIRHTSDGTDFFIQTCLLANPAKTLTFRDCFIASSNVIYACSPLYIYKSMDGGANFDSIYVFPNGNYNRSLCFTSSTTGWLTASSALYKTIDGGLNWTTSLTTDYVDKGAIDFSDANTGVFTDGIRIYKTTDGGLHWTKVFTYSSYSIEDIDIVSASEFYFTNSVENRVYKTVDGGTTYTPVLSSLENGIIEIHFVDSHHGWACGGNGALYKFMQ